MLKNTDPLVKEAWQQVTDVYNLPQGSLPFLKEVAAHIGETAPDTNWFQNLIMKVKQFLRRLGFFDPKKITGEDIRDLIMYSLKRTLNERSATSRLNPNDFGGTTGILAKEVYSKDNPPGAHSPKTYKKILKMAGEGLKDIPKGNNKIYQAVRKAFNKLPDSLISMKMGLYGLVALNDLYSKYIPSLGKMLELLERRAGKADKARASVDRLGYLGMDIVKGNSRQQFKVLDAQGNEITLEDFQEGRRKIKEGVEVVMINTLPENTEVYPEEIIDEWGEVVYDLSRGEKGFKHDKGIDPTDPNNKFHPLVVRFREVTCRVTNVSLGLLGPVFSVCQKV